MLSMRLLLPNYKALDKNPPKMMSSVQKMVERIQSLHEAGLLAEHVAEEFISRGGGSAPGSSHEHRLPDNKGCDCCASGYFMQAANKPCYPKDRHPMVVTYFTIQPSISPRRIC
jgi:hypothetical protein